MADNIQLSVGTADGAVIATDDIGGVHYPIQKLAYGALESATLVTTLAGLPVQVVSPVGAGVEATAIRVTVATDSTGVLSVDDNGAALTVDNAGTFAVQVNGDALTALQLIDNAISGAGFNITQLGGAAVPIGAGLEATAVRVTLATDSTGLVSVDDNGANISIDWAGTVPPIGAGTEAAALRVTLATDSTGVLSIDDNGAAITVDGTVAVTSAGITTIAGAVSGTEMQVDIVAALPAGDNNIGNVDILSIIPGTGATNLGKAEDAAHSTGDTGVYVLAIRDDVLALHSGTDGDYESLHTDKQGALWISQIAGTPYKNIDVDETEDQISANPCVLYGFYAYSNVAAGTKRFLKIYNATAATVTVGTTTPDMTFELDGAQGVVWNQPLEFTVALTIAATTGVADNDTGAPGANDVVFNCSWK